MTRHFSFVNLDVDLGVGSSEEVGNGAVVSGPTSSFAPTIDDTELRAHRTPSERSLFGNVSFGSEESLSMASHPVTDPFANMLQPFFVLCYHIQVVM